MRRTAKTNTPDPDVLTDDGPAPVLGEDQGKSPPEVDEDDLPKAIALPIDKLRRRVAGEPLERRVV